METGFIIMIALLVGFALLGMYDGFYLHIFKYKLFQHEESKREHLTHTVRSILFPAILYCFYLTESDIWFFIGLSLAAIDIGVTMMDAYMEEDSRKFMGGLPRWEYLVHLAVNGLHFAAIAVFIAIKVRFTNSDIQLTHDFTTVHTYAAFTWVVSNLIPGAILMAALHIFVAIPSTAIYWNLLRAKVTCC